MIALLLFWGISSTNVWAKTNSITAQQEIFSQLKSCAKNLQRTDKSITKALQCSEQKFASELTFYERQEFLSIFAAPFRMSPLEVCSKMDSERARKMRLGNLDFRCFILIDDQNLGRKGFVFFESHAGVLKVADIKIF